MRLIDADKLSEQYEASMGELLKSTNCKNISLEALSLLCGAKIIANAPTIDAEPVVHGKWTTKRTQKHDGEWYCTVCDYEPIVMSDDMKYCPGCGAKMDLEGTA